MIFPYVHTYPSPLPYTHTHPHTHPPTHTHTHTHTHAHTPQVGSTSPQTMKVLPSGRRTAQRVSDGEDINSGACSSAGNHNSSTYSIFLIFDPSALQNVSHIEAYAK